MSFLILTCPTCQQLKPMLSIQPSPSRRLSQKVQSQQSHYLGKGCYDYVLQCQSYTHRTSTGHPAEVFCAAWPAGKEADSEAPPPAKLDVICTLGRALSFIVTTEDNRIPNQSTPARTRHRASSSKRSNSGNCSTSRIDLQTSETRLAAKL